MHKFSIAAAAMFLLAAPALGQDKQDSTLHRAGLVAEQPAKDVGAVKTKIPPVLQAAAAHAYSLEGLGSCTALRGAIGAISKELGPDFAGPVNVKKSRKMKVTGDTVAGLIVPFRGLVREVSGAAAAQRELNVAIDAGYARRGFLRGVYTSRRCKPAL